MASKISIIAIVVLTILVVGVRYLSPSLGGLIALEKEYPENTISIISFDSLRSAVVLNYAPEATTPEQERLRIDFKLDSIAGNSTRDFERVKAIQSWVHQQWDHDGTNVAEEDDAYYILTEAKKGRRFRCVEYSIVTKECLKALGFVVRGISLMTRDVSEVRYGAGHVANEIFLSDVQKWVFLDAQFDVIVTMNDVPLSAVEIQHAIVKAQPLVVLNPSNSISADDYLFWLRPYLFYFSVSLNKGKLNVWDRIVGTKKQLMLVPKEVDPPITFQGLFRLHNYIYTSSVADFYPIVE